MLNTNYGPQMPNITHFNEFGSSNKAFIIKGVTEREREYCRNFDFSRIPLASAAKEQEAMVTSHVGGFQLERAILQGSPSESTCIRGVTGNLQPPGHWVAEDTGQRRTETHTWPRWLYLCPGNGVSNKETCC